jgi:hypothetical protein
VKRLTFLILCLLCSGASADAPSAATQQEVSHLFSYLENSGCSFDRNGSWYDASKATAHLRQKYEYLLKKRLIASAEDFIARAATESSMSGKPYSVRCGDTGPVPSGAWFGAELQRYRQRKP